MKKDIKKVLIWIYFLLTWCSSRILANIDEYGLLFMASYFLAVVCLVAIKNKFISLILAYAVVVPSVFYDNEYLFLIVCPLFITYEYIQIFKNKEKDSKEKNEDKLYVGANIGVLSGGIVLIYQHFNPVEINTNATLNRDEKIFERSHIVILVMFIVLLIWAVVCSSKKTQWKELASKSGLGMVTLKKIQSVHVANVISYIETVILFYLINVNTSEYVEREFFLPWFLYFVVAAYYNDPIMLSLVDRIENIFITIAEKCGTKN